MGAALNRERSVRLLTFPLARSIHRLAEISGSGPAQELVLFVAVESVTLAEPVPVFEVRLDRLPEPPWPDADPVEEPWPDDGWVDDPWPESLPVEEPWLEGGGVDDPWPVPVEEPSGKVRPEFGAWYGTGRVRTGLIPAPGTGRVRPVAVGLLVVGTPVLPGLP
jgi:hypothetical protein